MPVIVILTLRVTLLSDSECVLTGYEYCARIMSLDDVTCLKKSVFHGVQHKVKSQFTKTFYI
ncbi:hypothetical protein C3397_14030 [Enterobacter cloacae complex sp. ECNIH16]|nr:hypothetical protein [Escherichia coli]POV39219.1 hypothetical protein C3394_16965 [Enterobacter cloacae complex sp. ECNIH11]POV43952.1 hypothetical protein C3397_14030 [Enterobacter cloacae complex sp. ECNIH16]